MSENLPPPNRALGWYRFLLWVMPSCVAITSAVAFSWLAGRIGWQAKPFDGRWLAFNFVATLGIGMFESMRRPREAREIFMATATFVFLQLFITPTIVVIIMIMWLSIVGVPSI